MAPTLSLALLKSAIGVGAPQPPPPPFVPTAEVHVGTNNENDDDGEQPAAIEVDAEKQAANATPTETGVTGIQAAQAIWGKHGRWLVIAGLCLIMVIYELDNTTVGVYRNYAFSEFNSLAQLGSLTTAGSIVFALAKPPLAKLSNVIGRGQTYIVTISLYLISYILMSTATSFNQYAAGSILHSAGQSGTNLLNDIVVGDITTARWRPLAMGLLFWPFVIIPWISAFIVDSATSANGIGWRWGIGMLGFIMPFAACFIVTTLIYYQGKAKKQGLAPRAKLSVYAFCSQIDLGGLIIFAAGLALLLLPMTLAGTNPGQWSAPWNIALIVVGGVLLVILPFYEHYVAKYPVIPPHYFANRTIALCLFVTVFDNIAFSVTHTYLFAWAKVAVNMSARDATFYTYTNGITQCLVAIIAGWFVGKTRRYKWMAVAGAAVRLIGYGVMALLRGSENSLGEIFTVQLIQGLGSGMLGAVHLVPSQAVVPHSQMPQMTALNICLAFVGSSIGACISGGIYTNSLQPALWYHLGEKNTTAAVVTALANSITGVVPVWGTPARIAVSNAFSDVLRYMTYAAIGTSVPVFIASMFFTDFELPDRNNLVEE